MANQNTTQFKRYVGTPKTAHSNATINRDLKEGKGTGSKVGSSVPSKPLPNATGAKSQSAADKEYIEMEYSLLEGDMKVLPIADTVYLRAGMNITLARDNVGCLAGEYLITEARHTLSPKGYDIELKVQRNGFTDKIFKEGARDTGKRQVVG